MKMKLAAALAMAGILAGSSVAVAQDASSSGPLSTSGGQSGATGGASMSMDDDTKAEFRTYITTQKIVPVTVEGEVVVGSSLPDTVALQPVPDVIVTKAPTWKDYRYAVVGERIVVVEPTTTQVVTVID